MADLRAGIIGTGRAAGFIDDEIRARRNFALPYGHAGAYAKAEGVRLVAAASRGRERLEAFGARYGVKALYQDVREMLERERLDIVSVTTHTPLHAEHVIAAVEAGVRGIYCEKAIAVSLAEADAMLDVVARHDARLIIGHTRRWQDFWIQANAVLRRGDIGDLSAVMGYWGGSLVHSGTHAFDLICWAVDATPMAVMGTLDREPDYGATDYGRVDVGGNGIVEFENGVRAFIAASGGKMTPFDFDFIGNRGILRCAGNGTRMELVTPDEAGVPRSVDLELPPPNSASTRAVQELVNCLRTGSEPDSDGHAGRTALEVAHAFHHSHRRDGARVHLPLEDRSLRVLNR